MRDKLKIKRKDKNLTQKELAKRASISQRSYQRIEQGIQNPKYQVAILIAKALDCSVEEIFED